MILLVYHKTIQIQKVWCIYDKDGTNLFVLKLLFINLPCYVGVVL